MATVKKGLANKWLVLALLLAALGAVLAVTLLPAGAQDAAIEFPENSTESVANFTAVDPEGSRVTWNDLGGPDAAAFDLTAGVLTFMEAPNFEAPTDVGGTAGDNVYELVLMATDAGETSGTENITVEVTNVDEPATTTFEVSLVQPREGQNVTVVYADGVGNPFVDDMGEANTGIVDPDGDKDVTTDAISEAETAIPAEDVEWQWSRGTSLSGTFTEITEAENSSRDQDTYLVVDADRNHFLRVTATYEDKHGEGKTWVATAREPVKRLRDDQVAPEFPEDFNTATPTVLDDPMATIPDGATEGTIVGSAVTASRENAEGELLTYSIQAEDSPTADSHTDLFQIDRATGQVTVGLGKTVNPATDANTNVDPPKGASFMVTISVTDSVTGNTDTVDMTINVTSTDENPVFLNGETSHEYAEIDADRTDRNVYTFTAYDPEDGNVTFTLTGPDADKFTTGADDALEGGTLAFEADPAAAPDYENPADANKDNIYEVTVTASATSDTNADGDDTTDPEELTTPIDVTVEVTNQQDDGSLELSARQPRIGVPISAINLSDLDGSVSDVSYQWSRADDAAFETNIVLIEDADTDTYTPVNADDGKYLRARAEYTDPQGDGSADAISAQMVARARNLAPNFADVALERYVVENAALNAVVIAATTGDDTNADAPNDRITATDDLDADTTDNDQVSYTLGGPDAMYFSIDTTGGTAGQIRVSAAGEALPLDYEIRRAYTVTVTAADPEGLSSSTSVTINIADVNEGPEIMRRRLAVSGEPLVEYASMGTGDVATYTAVGVDADGATWTLSGDDAGDFSIGQTDGVLTFNTPPNVANPADANGDNIYMVTVEAASGDSTANKPVTVTVGMAMAAPDLTTLDNIPHRQRFDLDSNGIVDDSDIQQALIIWAQDNPEN